MEAWDADRMTVIMRARRVSTSGEAFEDGEREEQQRKAIGTAQATEPAGITVVSDQGARTNCEKQLY